eukprot:TRINITY_DN2556_c0_g1_i1.p1 TRINITY_DN2556_c0_g1~~TRINITY_DN2556_c0_g1_i1.p1  ORF type:complete len:222 (-),score=60.83 TRINITY_DN2556_c0_g1_i1:220-885(-)
MSWKTTCLVFAVINTIGGCIFLIYDSTLIAGGNEGAKVSIITTLILLGLGVFGIFASIQKDPKWSKFYLYGIVAYIAISVVFQVSAFSFAQNTYDEACSEFNKNSDDFQNCKNTTRSVAVFGLVTGLVISVAICSCCACCVWQMYKEKGTPQYAVNEWGQPIGYASPPPMYPNQAPYYEPTHQPNPFNHTPHNVSVLPVGYESRINPAYEMEDNPKSNLID